MSAHSSAERFESRHDKTVTTSDGADLHYVDIGEGRTIVMVPGWSQSAAMFKHQYIPCSKHFRCIAVNMRGHGESAPVERGFTIEQFAHDLHDLITTVGGEKPILMGHSMGASVLWAYSALYGTEHIAKMAFVDQSPCLISDPSWSEVEQNKFGAIFTSQSLEEICAGLLIDDGKATTEQLLRNMFDQQISDTELNWVLRENLKFDRQRAVALLRDHCAQDWRDTVQAIDIPCLVIGGKTSIIPWQSQLWLSEQLAESQFHLFNKDEAGHHFMFLDNPAKFNKIICNFCQ